MNCFQSSKVRARLNAAGLGMRLVGVTITLGASTATLAQPGPPRMVADLGTAQSSFPFAFAAFQPTGGPVGALFVCNDASLTGSSSFPFSLWFHDGLTARSVKSGLASGSEIRPVDLGNGRAVFLNGDTATGLEPWATDGTAAGTGLLADTTPGTGWAEARSYMVWNGRGYLGPWATDGTPAGTRDLRTLLPASGGAFTLLGGVAGLDGAADGQWMVFVAGGNVYRTDGSAQIPTLLASVPIAGSGVWPLGVVRAGAGGGADRVIWGQGPASSWELWSSDGTPAGTSLIRSFVSSVDAVRGNSVDGAVYFAVGTPTQLEIWKTDGTPAGSLRAGIHGGFAAAVDNFTTVGSRVLYRAGSDLYRLETAAPSTRLTNFGVAAVPSEMVSIGDLAVFAHSETATGLEPWITDGTAAGTHLLADLYPGAVSGLNWTSTAPPPVTALPPGRGAMIAARRSDSSTTQSLYWIHPATGQPIALLSGATSTGNLLVRPEVVYLEPPGVPPRAVFRGSGPGGVEVWAADFVPSPTEPGVLVTDAAHTYRLTDVDPGSSGIAPRNLGKVGRKVMFTAQGEGNLVGVSDGTAAGTGVLMPNWRANVGNDEPHTPKALLDRYYFQSSAGNSGIELFGSDGTSQGTGIVADTAPNGTSGYGDFPISSGGSIYFRQLSVDHRLWRFEPATGAAQPVTASTVRTGFPVPVNSINALADLNGVICIVDGSRLMRVNSANNAVAVVKTGIDVTLNPLGPTLYKAGNLLYFLALSNVAAGYEVHVTDAVAGGAGTRMLKDMNPGGVSSSTATSPYSPWAFAEVGQMAAFVASPMGNASQAQLWISDGTEPGTQLLNIPGAAAQPQPKHLCEFDGRLAFSALAPNLRRLFISDLTLEGTFMVPDNSLVGVNVAGQPISVRGRLYFAGSASFTDSTGAAVFAGTEPWVSDGTAAGTRMLMDIVPGSGSSSPQNFTLVNSRLFFTATTPVAGEELWVYDLCPGDFDNSGSLDVGDLFAFLGAWFGGDAAADVDGGEGVTVGDLFTFLDHWFTGCPV